MSAISLSGPIAVGVRILCASACGGGDRDANRPTVSAVSPARDSNSAVITANICASFDRAMDANTIDADVIWPFRTGGRIVRVSVNADGVDADGRYIGFESDASNLVLNDTNGLRDIFRSFNELF